MSLTSSVELSEAVKNYPLFTPPKRFGEKPYDGWSAVEARAYKDWVAEVLEERTDALMGILDQHGRSKPEAHLRAIGAKAAELFLSGTIFPNLKVDDQN